MKLSVVATMYRSERYVREFYDRIVAQLRPITNDYEIVLVNDGSPDNSIDVARAIPDDKVIIIDLSRNFGHHKAMMCGLEHATGERVFLTDIDLEEAPENLGRFWQAMEGSPETDVVIGQVAQKAGSAVKRAMSDWFYVVFNLFSSVKLSNREMVSRLMKRNYLDALLRYRERELFIAGIWAHAGFRQLFVDARKDFDGHSSYTLRRRIRLAVDAITSFSSKPLVLIFYLGCLTSLFSASAIVWLTLRKLLFNDVFMGWTSLFTLICLVGGILIFCMGLIGIYVARIYEEVKHRPNTIVRSIYRAGERK